MALPPRPPSANGRLPAERMARAVAQPPAVPERLPGTAGRGPLADLRFSRGPRGRPSPLAPGRGRSGLRPAPRATAIYGTLQRPGSRRSTPAGNEAGGRFFNLRWCPASADHLTTATRRRNLSHKDGASGALLRPFVRLAAAAGQGGCSPPYAAQPRTTSESFRGPAAVCRPPGPIRTRHRRQHGVCTITEPDQWGIGDAELPCDGLPGRMRGRQRP